ncbi:MAG: DUF3078 domain-containing protein [Bacteroidota bacterium]
MKKSMLTLLCISFSVSVIAQNDTTGTKKDTTYWTKGGVININFSQVGLYNWAAGGENNISVAGLFSAFANYKKESTTWDNNLEMAYGNVKPGEKSFRKTDDRFEVNSKFGHLAINKWYYSALFNFRTQFADGIDFTNENNPTIISSALAPAYITLGIGMDYKPNDNFNIFASPLTGRVTYVGWQSLADKGAFGVEKAQYDLSTGALLVKGKKVRNEFGAYFKMNWKKEIMKNVSFKTNLALFSNYLDRPQNIDILWDVLLALKVNKYITASVTTNLIYDNDIEITQYSKTINPLTGDRDIIGVGPRTQFKQVLAVGFSYKF